MIATTLGASNTSATVTNSNAVTRPAFAPNLSLTATNNDVWDTTFLQDPEQLRRLQNLYQYGAQQIPAESLLCNYPIPERLQNQQQQGSSSQKQNQQAKRRYVRIVNVGSSYTSCIPGGPASSSNSIFLVGDDPDPAFLSYPNCIICAVPSKELSDFIKKSIKSLGLKIYKSTYTAEEEAFSDKFEYVPVILNPELKPNSELVADVQNGNRSWANPGLVEYRMIDWMSVVKNEVDPIPSDAKRIGSSAGYTVYIHPSAVNGECTSGDCHFSKFVLAVLAAVLKAYAEYRGVAATDQAAARRFECFQFHGSNSAR
jgi:hypothetical protein